MARTAHYQWLKVVEGDDFNSFQQDLNVALNQDYLIEAYLMDSLGKVVCILKRKFR